MSGILGVFSSGRQQTDAAAFRRMVEAGRRRGADRSDAWHTSVGSLEAARIQSGPVGTGTGVPGSIGVHRFEWELHPDHSGETMVLDEGDVVVAADASIYHPGRLRRRIGEAGVAVSEESPSHLIVGAYRAWGAGCPLEIEGNLAFLLYDRVKNLVFCARDLSGSRPLFFAETGGALVVASNLAPILLHPEVSEELNLARIGAAAAGLPYSLGSDTAYSAIQVVPSAGALSWKPGGAAKVWRYWSPPEGESGEVPSFDAAAEVLRSYLLDSVGTRLSRSGATTVWMSGGWDSTSVFATGMAVLRDTSESPSRTLRPVSVSYPKGDPGREDEIISAIGRFWNTPVHWLDIQDIPLIEKMEERAAGREEPTAHIYENFNRALASGTRACDSRIALEGNGGDQLFGGTGVFLADLLKTGRWAEMVREIKLRRHGGARFLLRTTLLPLLPPWLLQAGGGTREWRPVGHYLERPIPAWIRSDFVRRADLVDREVAHLPPLGSGSREAAEMRWFVCSPMTAYHGSQMSTLLLGSGIEVRSPLFERRIIEFALGRPREERVWRTERKRLLRRSIRGLLPDDVLAPRPYRTGTTTRYSQQGMLKAFPSLFHRLFQAKLVLSELGIVDPEALKAGLGQFLERGDEPVRIALYHTLQSELWLRAHIGA